MVKFRSDVDYEETVRVLDKIRKPAQIHAEEYVIIPEDKDEHQNSYDLIEIDDDDFWDDA